MTKEKGEEKEKDRTTIIGLSVCVLFQRSQRAKE